MLHLRIGLICSLVATLAFCADAQAATRYAAPGGVATGVCATTESACDIVHAVNDAANNDEIVLAPGEYGSAIAPITTSLGLTTGVNRSGLNIHGTPGAVKPVIHISGTAFYSGISVVGGHIADLDLHYYGATAGLFLSNATAERVAVVAHSSSTACGMSDANTIKNSTFLIGGVSAVAIRLAQSGNIFTLELRNVTAWATGATGRGLDVQTSSSGSSSVTAANSIFHGVALDVAAAADGTALAVVSLENSNFNTTSANGGGASVSSPTALGNQSTAPSLKDPSAGDFTELTGSPTIDAGADNALNGTLDLVGAPRVQGARTDIGALELSPPPATGPPPAEAGPKLLQLKWLGTSSFKANPYSAAGSLTKTTPLPRKYKPYGRRLAVQTDLPATVHFTLQTYKSTKVNGKKRFSWKSKPGETTMSAIAGTTSAYFSGRWKGKALASGTYRLVATISRQGEAPPPTDGKDLLVRRTVKFTIQKPRQG